MNQSAGILPKIQERTSGTRTQRRVLFVFLIIIGVCVVHAVSLPTVLYPLKESPVVGPYQDEDFMDIATSTIYELSNATIPNGTELRNLQTTQQNLATMNISPEFYPKARLINAYLYYTAEAGDSYSDAMSLAGKAYSPTYEDSSVLNEAHEYQAAATAIWNQIEDLFPQVEPYKLTTVPTLLSVNEDPNFKQPNNPFSSYSEEDAIYDRYYR